MAAARGDEEAEEGEAEEQEEEEQEQDEVCPDEADLMLGDAQEAQERGQEEGGAQEEDGPFQELQAVHMVPQSEPQTCHKQSQGQQRCQDSCCAEHRDRSCRSRRSRANATNRVLRSSGKAR